LLVFNDDDGVCDACDDDGVCDACDDDGRYNYKWENL
jgi:hypothetical protein